VTNHDQAMPSIGTRVEVLHESHSDSGAFQSAIVVGHLNDPVLGGVLELRLSNSQRMQRTWPTSTVRLLPAA